MGNLALNGHCGQTAKDKAEEKQAEADFVKQGGAKQTQERKQLMNTFVNKVVKDGEKVVKTEKDVADIAKAAKDAEKALKKIADDKRAQEEAIIDG